ncbi:hypothetical protein BY996DRAFT_6416479 [Phakopsora pachyrhizi]|nr:hypothetical protein BY996DRAFT_6416479 [Phakopsora pachyrhizi]
MSSIYILVALYLTIIRAVLKEFLIQNTNNEINQNQLNRREIINDSKSQDHSSTTNVAQNDQHTNNQSRGDSIENKSIWEIGNKADQSNNIQQNENIISKNVQENNDASNKQQSNNNGSNKADSIDKIIQNDSQHQNEQPNIVRRSNVGTENVQGQSQEKALNQGSEQNWAPIQGNNWNVAVRRTVNENVQSQNNPTSQLQNPQNNWSNQ